MPDRIVWPLWDFTYWRYGRATSGTWTEFAIGPFRWARKVTA